MIDQLKAWWKARKIACTAASIQKTIAAVQRDVQDAMSQFQEERIRLESELADALRRLGFVEKELQDLEQYQKRYEAENEALRTKVSILERVAVPGLTQSNQVLLERLDAMTAHEIRKQVLYKSAGGE